MNKTGLKARRHKIFLLIYRVLISSVVPAWHSSTMEFESRQESSLRAVADGFVATAPLLLLDSVFIEHDHTMQ